MRDPGRRRRGREPRAVHAGAHPHPRGPRPEESPRPGGAGVIEQLIRKPLTELTGVRHPVVQTGMGWVAGPPLVSGTTNVGGLCILASGTMSYDELEHAVLEVKCRTDHPFGMNLRADTGDAPERVDL